MSKVCLMCGETFPDSTTFCPKDGSALRAAVQGDDLIGEVFCDRYVVTDLLGEGGMGLVYVARDVRLPQQVAIKVLRDRTAADPTAVARFRQEAEAASRINHDRVARVSDFGFMNDGRAYIIMEYVSGRTLKQTIDARGPLPPAEVAKITGMVAEGLDAAHRLGIVHRDLKPENVMIVDDAGGGMRVKVLDFGIAKVLQSEESAGRTAPGFVIGTPPWMSPEQILGETLDARSDVFSLALIAYAMLTGRRAFSGNSEQAEMLARLSSKPTPLDELLPGVVWPVGLQALLDRTLSRDVNQRPNGALAFARELAKVVEAVATSAANGTVVTPRLPEREFRNATRIMMGVGSVLVLAIVSVVVSRALGSRPAPIPSIAGGNTSAIDSLQPNAPLTSVPTASVASTAADTAKGQTSVPPAPITASSLPRSPAAPASNGGRTTISPANVGNTATPAGQRTGRGSSTPDTSAEVPPAVSQSSAHDELQRLIDDAEADIGASDSNAARAKAREVLRKLDLLAPKITDDTDRGWIQLQTGEARATLGEADKACTAFQRAHALSDKSRALKSSAENWQRTLSCLK